MEQRLEQVVAPVQHSDGKTGAPLARSDLTPHDQPLDPGERRGHIKARDEE